MHRHIKVLFLRNHVQNIVLNFLEKSGHYMNYIVNVYSFGVV